MFALTSPNLWHGRGPKFHSNLRQRVHLGLVCRSRTPRMPIPNSFCLFTLPNRHVCPGLGLLLALLSAINVLHVKPHRDQVLQVRGFCFSSVVLHLSATLYLSCSHLLIAMPSISPISIDEQGERHLIMLRVYTRASVCNMSNP